MTAIDLHERGGEISVARKRKMMNYSVVIEGQIMAG
jgi:hypothetical protein